MNLENVNHLVQNVKVAPWRIQRQWLGAVLGVVLGLLMIATLLLDVSSQAALAGREVQSLNQAISQSEENTGNLQTQLAILTSTEAMSARAKEMGFEPVDPADVEFIQVPGYFVPEPDILAPAAQPGSAALHIPPEYKESLFDWLNKKIAAGPRGQE